MSHHPISAPRTATGQKLTKQSGSTYKYYANGIEYNNNALEAVYFSEGRVPPGGSPWKYQYALKDHLGNGRVWFEPNSTNTGTVVTQQAHYYAFGMEIEGLTSAAAPNKYRYNGKELNEDFGLGWNDYGARWYDPAVGRWWSVDPLAKFYASYSPYNYGINNPILYTDPDGMSVTRDVYLDQNDNVIKTVDDGTKTDHYYRANEDGKGYLEVTEDLGTDYISRTTLRPIFSERSWLSTASYGYNSTLRSTPAYHLYNFSDKTPEYLKDIIGGLFALEGISEKGAESVMLYAGKKLTQDQKNKGIASLQKQIEKHQRKLEEYMKNPDAYDNKGFLKNIGEAIREKIIQTRIRGLQKEIQKFENEIQKLINDL